MIEGKTENLIDDRVYDSDKLDEDLRQVGIEMITTPKRNRGRPRKQSGLSPATLQPTLAVEHFFARIQLQRRLLLRWEYYAEIFPDFALLATIAILIKLFLDRL